MAEMHADPSSSDADLDLTQFYPIFFEEATENLNQMERLLLDLDLVHTVDEDIHGIFRCAHSIKGGAATFGFSDVAEQFHQMESLLDRLRRHELQLIPSMVDVLLESTDASRSMLARHQSGGVGEATNTTALVERIRLLACGEGPLAVACPGVTVAFQAVSAPNIAGTRSLVIQMGPLEKPEQADAVKELFRDISGLGTITALPSDIAATRVFAVETTCTDNDLLDLFVFYVSKDVVRIREVVAESIASKLVSTGVSPNGSVEEVGEFFSAPTTVAKAEKAPGYTPLETSTIRVDIKKLDQLQHLVGKLAATQAILAHNSQGLEPGLHRALLAGLADLGRNTRDVQASVLSLHRLPIANVMSRFPRMVRDLAHRLGKKVDFVTQGGSIELDKDLVEKIIDPLTHLVRNSCDHGIEMPQDRIAAGKPQNGTITLSATHQGAFILMEVRDDGKGLSREKIIHKARERGLNVGDGMTDAEVWQLVFAPGFSTADLVTDVSGRGVGMDVVQRNVASLKGTVDIESAEGLGMKVSMRLPMS